MITSYGYAPILGPCMTITMPVGGPCSMHGHEGPGACGACQAEIVRFNAECQKAFPPPGLRLPEPLFFSAHDDGYPQALSWLPALNAGPEGGR